MTDAIETIRITVLKTDELTLIRAQRDLYAELEGETIADLERFATVLVPGVIVDELSRSSTQ